MTANLCVLCIDATESDCTGDIAWWCAFIEATDCYDASATCCRTCEQHRKQVPGDSLLLLNKKEYN